MYNLYNGKKLIASEITKADKFFSRFKGLMFKKFMGRSEGLFIIPCKQVHTFNMRFDIDVIFLDKHHEVLHIEHSMKPGKLSKSIRGAHSVIELCAGVAAQHEIRIGDTLLFEEKLTWE